MNTHEQIARYLDSLQEPKRAELRSLHQHLLTLLPARRVWFLDGTDEKGKVVANPQIGYGEQRLTYADGKTKEFYQVGISANTTGISVYIMGLRDKRYLPNAYGTKIGKASVTGYCVKFKKIGDIDQEVLDQAIQDGIRQTS